MNEFHKLPWLMEREEVAAVTGFAPHTISKMVESGLLVRVKLAGPRYRYRKVQIAKLCGEKMDEDLLRQFRGLPKLLGGEVVGHWLGASRHTVYQMGLAKRLRVVRLVTIGSTRYLKADLAAMLGIERLI